jgi:transcription elongation factor GreA-like protein
MHNSVLYDVLVVKPSKSFVSPFVNVYKQVYMTHVNFLIVDRSHKRDQNKKHLLEAILYLQLSSTRLRKVVFATSFFKSIYLQEQCYFEGLTKF